MVYATGFCLILTHMKKLFLLFIVIGACVSSSAQKVFFIYLQTESQVPFYVRMYDKVYSSTSSGYVILPNLTDSSYTLNIGFPRSSQPEARFIVTIAQNDKGFLIKNFSEELVLFDLQDLSIVKSATASNSNIAFETKTDKFTAILSKAAEDPSLLKVPVAKKEDLKPKSEEKKEATIPSTESTIVQEDKLVESKVSKTQPTDNKVVEVIAKPKQTEAVITDSEEVISVKSTEGEKSIDYSTYKPSTVVRRSESSTTEGFGVVFFDKMENQIDTIRILIPSGKYKNVADVPTENLSEIQKRAEISSGTDITPISVEQNRKQTSGTAETMEKVEVPSKTAAVQKSNTSCKETASDRDFLKLRKNMAAKETDEAMIDEAKKAYKSKCYTVEQLRFLSTLFMTGAAKYQFFDASFANTADPQNYSSLQSEIKDSYYLKRFKALIGE